MSNLKEKSKKSEVQLNQLGDMLKLVALEYPNVTSAKELSILISEGFNVICTENDILGYHEQFIIHEDFELENRKQEYGINY